MSLTKKLLLFFVVLPLVELVLLVTLSHYTSLTFTILFIVVTGLLGTWLAKSQGLQTYRRIQQELAGGRMPTETLVDGGLILLAGLLLVAPGVFTDISGILLMFPPTRVLARRWLIDWFKRNFKVQMMLPQQGMNRGDVVDSYASDSSPRKGEIIDAPRLENLRDRP